MGKNKDLEIERKTYYLSKGIIKSIDLMSAITGKNKSVIVEEALDNYMPIDIKEKAKDILKEQEGK